MRSDSRLTTIVTRTLTALLLVLALGVTTRAARSGQEAPAAAPQHEAAHAEAAEGEHAHESGWFPTIAKMFNFAVLVGVLVYFLREPLTVYSEFTHHESPRGPGHGGDDAGDRESAARRDSSQGERAARRVVRVETARRGGNCRGACADRGGRRNRTACGCSTRRGARSRCSTRILKRQLLEFAATQAVAVATRRITQTITPADQARLVDRYAAQLKETGL